MDIFSGGVGEVAAAVGLSALFKMRSSHRTATEVSITQLEAGARALLEEP